MANANHKKLGSGIHGKGSGAGGMTDLPDGVLEENMVLSNRDKALHSDERGLDGKAVQTEQFQDHSANHLVDVEEGAEAASLGQAAGTPAMNTSGADSSQRKRS